MKSKFFLFVVFLFSFRASASAGVLATIGVNNVFEREAYPTEYSSRTPFVIRVGYQELSSSVFAEYNQFTASDDISQLQITRTQREFLIWGRQSFWPDDIFQAYVQIATGMELQYVTTQFMGTTSQDTSKPYLALGGAAGLATQWDHIRIELEFKALSSALAAPNPTLSVGVYAGYLF